MPCFTPAHVPAKRPPYYRSINITAGFLSQVVKEYLITARLEKFQAGHLRHTFAINLLRKGVPLKVVSELMGHASVTATEIYAKVIPESTEEAIQKLD